MKICRDRQEPMKIKRKETEISNVIEWTRKYLWAVKRKRVGDHVCQKWDILELQNDYGKKKCPMSLENY